MSVFEPLYMFYLHSYTSLINALNINALTENGVIILVKNTFKEFV